MLHKFITIFNTKLELLSYNTLYEILENNIQNKKIKNIITCDFRDIDHFRKHPLHIENVVYYPDSTGMYLALKIFFRKHVKDFKKIVSTDFHYELLGVVQEKKYRIFFLGDTTEILNKFISRISNIFPNIEIVGYANGFNDLEDKNLITRINDSGADIILVGLGVPKQANWLAQNSKKMNVPIRITVGAFFTFYSGEIKRAPLIIRKLSLEWLYRLINEPVRLFKRYFITLPKILILIAKERWKKLI